MALHLKSHFFGGGQMASHTCALNRFNGLLSSIKNYARPAASKSAASTSEASSAAELAAILASIASILLFRWAQAVSESSCAMDIAYKLARECGISWTYKFAVRGWSSQRFRLVVVVVVLVVAIVVVVVIVAVPKSRARGDNAGG